MLLWICFDLNKRLEWGRNRGRNTERRRRETFSININFSFVQQKWPNRILSGIQFLSNTFVIHIMPLYINMEYFNTESQQSLWIVGNVALPHLLIYKKLDLSVDINQTFTMNKSICLLQGTNIELFNVNTLERERETRLNVMIRNTVFFPKLFCCFKWTFFPPKWLSSFYLFVLHIN